MNVYRASFSENKMLRCQSVCESLSDYSSSYYEVENGKLTFAIIKAEALTDAQDIAEAIARSVSRKLAAAA